ncbi:Ig-like domain-containing protein [Haloferula sp. A504]|uniref:Ig-like domain-containing protein n=1 Tax=Haloferula sp. A504 TaxID=3373601 RepID=UPI0031C6C042|nr:Ig-like domain-containing protein [Verrucomicrobiaceae bacterium E54]
MNPKPAPSVLGTAILGLAIAMTPLHAGVVFSESFEIPVVSGFDDNTVPSGGNWIGATDGFGSSNRGLYNETVVWPATPPFTTPYGNQAYYLNYTNSGLTTAEGVIGALTADVTYSVTFNTAVTASTASGNYKVELVAFSPGDDRADVNGTPLPGTVLASATGAVTTDDMSATGSLTFTPDGANAHLGKDVGIRLVKSTNSVLYDNIRLITGHDLNPNPASGEDLAAGGNVTLSWTNMPPNTGDTYVDVLFGTDPGSLAPVLDGQIASSTIVNAPQADTYYWRVDSYPDGDPDGTPVTGDVFFFTVADTDGDGLPDSWELANGTDPNVIDDTADPDVDGLTNAEEYQYGTKANDNDTDDDTLLDGAEINGTAGLRPPTNPLLADTDADGLSDGVETNTGTWVPATPPATVSSDTGTNPTDNDWDKDGLLDGAETNTGTLVDKTNTGTDPYLSDTDSDGAGDYYEVYASFTNPFDDTDKPFVPYPLPDPDGSTGNPSLPVKVYICSGQSNMVGIGNVGPLGTAGTLETITKIENKFPNLLDGSNNWTERQDVLYRGVISATANGPLTAGQGAGDGPGPGDKLGPELGFGHIMGWYHDEAVLVLKSSIGNRSLGWDILPQGSVQYDYSPNTYAGFGDAQLKWPIGDTPAPWVTGGWYAGYEWDRYFRDESEWAHPHDAETNVVDILDDWNGKYGGAGKPFEGRDFEIAGFVWWQGDKDRGDMGHATRYEQNLVNLINNLRSYYSNRYPGKVPVNAPFVLATLGQTAAGDTSPASDVAIFDAQMAVDGDAGNYPEYQNNVKTVYAHPLSQGGASNSHYNGNAETYMLVGDALGRAMIDLLEASAGPDEIPPVIIGRSPEIGETDVSAGANIVINFNEPVTIGTGNITLHPIDNSGDVVIDANDATQVWLSGSTLTINPTASLATSKEYAVLIADTAIDDLAGNSFAGILVDTEWRFTTATPDTTDPTLSSTDPANDTSILVDGDLEATFSEPITVGSGNITLRNLTDGPSGDVVIDVTDGSQVTVSGAVLTINPTADLVGGKDYAVRIDATAIDDLVGNSYAGIGDDVTWFFSTPAPPPPNVVFQDNFEPTDSGSNATSLLGAGTTPDVSTYTVPNTSTQVNTTLWVRSNQGYKSSQSGLVDESESGGANFTDPTGTQAYAGRYSSNTGVSSAADTIGALASGTTITVQFDAVTDGQTGGDDIKAALVLYDGGLYNDFRNEYAGTSAVLARLNQADATTSSYQTFSFSYTVGDPVYKNGADGGGGTTWLPGLLGQDIGLRFYNRTGDAIIDNVQVSIAGPGGPGPVDHFTISAITSPQTVGVPITGITITAQDVSDATVTDFTGTVTFGGTGGFSGTSANFVDGVLSGVSVTPTVAGSDLTFTVDDGAGHTGSTTIALIDPAETAYQTWSGGLDFETDTNGDGVANGLAFALGAADPQADALALLPAAATEPGFLALQFQRAGNLGAAKLYVEHGNDLGGWTQLLIPATSTTAPHLADGVQVVVATGSPNDTVTVKIPTTLESTSGALFGRLRVTEN